MDLDRDPEGEQRRLGSLPGIGLGDLSERFSYRPWA